MRQVFIRELSCYSPSELADKVDIPVSQAKGLIEVLTTCGVLKMKTSNEVSEYEVIDTDAAVLRGKYQFVYVGIAKFNDVVIIVYPKYFREHEPDKHQVRQIFRVIRKASGSFSEIAAASEDGMRQNDKLALMLAILEQYGEYGLYSNEIKEYERNGYGDISWERTIAKHDAFLNDGQPVYFDYETHKTTQDQTDFVTRFHAYAVTECSRFMSDSGLGELLALDEVELTDSELDDFGDRDYMEYRLDKELGVQFITWKQELIGLLKRFIQDEETAVQSEDVMCLGISSFYHVWEQACKTAFNDMLDKPLGRLPVKLEGEWKSRSGEKLLDIIPRPAWFVRNDYGDYRPCAVADTLIPDTVTIGNDADGRSVFAILDAKYYTPTFGKSVAGAPGVESITKQHLYQAAYKQFVLECGFDEVVNAFVAPSEHSESKVLGKVEYSDVLEELPKPFTNEILMWALPAERIWDCYLRNKVLEKWLWPDDK